MKCLFSRINDKCVCEICSKTIECEDCRRLDVECVSLGVGDTIAKIASTLGIAKCDSCDERRKKLNEMFPYK